MIKLRRRQALDLAGSRREIADYTWDFGSLAGAISMRAKLLAFCMRQTDMTTNWRLAFAGAATACLLVAGAPALAQLNETVNEAQRSTTAAAASQARIDGLADQRGDLFREYRATLQRIDAQQLFVDQQRVFLASQSNEITDLERQITEVEDVLRNLLPMQYEMIENLQAFVAVDIPFLRAERAERVARLTGFMNNPAIAPAERYRLIVEAYEIEADYGRFLKTWDGPLNPNPLSDEAPDETAKTVDYLLIGRVAFIYAAQDGSEMGIWNAEAAAWDDLSDSYRVDVRTAVRMAKEVTTPDVFLGPVPGSTDITGSEG